MSKKKSTTVERMLFESNLRQSIEQSLRTEDQLSDMERQDYINQINDLKGYVKQLLGMIDTLKQTLDTVSASNRRNEELVKKLTAQIEELQRLVKNLEDRDRRHNKNTFGQKTHKAKKRVEDGRANGENANGKQDRDEEREDYDGSHDSSDVDQSGPSQNEEERLDRTKVKSEHLDEKRGPRGPYNDMDAAITEVLECNIDDIPKDMKFIGFKDVDENDSRGSRPINAFLGDFKGTIMSDAFIVYKQLTRDNPDLLHCLCWSHVLCKFGYAVEISKEEDGVWFQNMIRYLYLVEDENIIMERTPDEIKKRRAEKDVTDTLIALHDRAEKLLRTKGNKYSDLMVTALNYMLNGWDELLNYRNDGRYTIDNLEAERTVRPITRARKSSLHHSSEEGLQMALAYMTIIESAKRLGHECKDFLVRAWREAIYGNNDLEAMLQPVVVAK